MKNARLFYLSIFLGCAAVSRADILVDTFGTSGTGYHPIAGWTINSGSFIGQSFTTAGTYTFQSIDLPFRMAAETDQFQVNLRSSTAGLPGSVIESFTVTNAFGASTSGLYQLTSSLSPILNPGTYFITVEGLADGAGRWLLNTGANTGQNVVSVDGGGIWSPFTDTLGALRVSGAQVVPEPATMAALGLGIVAMMRRRKKA